ncbi:MAG: sigma-70 family RNA polymerase sigma factor [Candidatus Acidiferrales bacterium]
MQPNSTTEIEALYVRYGPALLLFAMAMTGERSRAQDALHQVFLRLLERREAKHVDDIKAYLFACVRNTVLNDTKVRGRTVPLDDQSARWFDPPDRDYAEELSLRRALNVLSDEQREVMILHVWGDLTFAQVAEIVGISPNTAASRYRYGLAGLRDAMCVKENTCASTWK